MLGLGDTGQKESQADFLKLKNLMWNALEKYKIPYKYYTICLLVMQSHQMFVESNWMEHWSSEILAPTSATSI